MPVPFDIMFLSLSASCFGVLPFTIVPAQLRFRRPQRPRGARVRAGVDLPPLRAQAEDAAAARGH
eukprot:389160-Lingulodinium_polyedra.AAC.1